MRTTFIETLYELAAEDERIWLLTGDLGYSVLERFAGRFPGRYVNVGVAEQNMTGVAAGLALSGKIVFTYSIANFPTVRCLEQIRNDVCYHNLNVKIIAVGGGLAYGAQGYTHHGLEDLAIMRSLPNMTVIAPGDPVETKLATRMIVNRNGPCYLRLGKAGDLRVHEHEPEFEIGKPVLVRQGTDVVLMSTGGALGIAVEVSAQLGVKKVNAGVISMPFLQPLDSKALAVLIDRIPVLVTIEEHSLVGGLRTTIIEALQSAFKPSVELFSFGLVPAWVTGRDHQADNHTFADHSLDSRQIAEKVLRIINKR